MTVQDLIDFLSTLDKKKEIYTADYYYEVREGFTPFSKERIGDAICLPEDTEHWTHYSDVYLLDFTSYPRNH